MATFKTVNKKVVLDKEQIVKIQFIYYLFLNKMTLSNAEIDCICLLSELKEHDLSDFCEKVVDTDIFASTQTVRNSIMKMEKLGLVVKFGKSKKLNIKLNPDVNIQTDGNIYLNYNLYYVKSQESQRTN